MGPNVVYNTCCGTEKHTQDFLDACSQVVAPATCESVTEGAAVTADATTVSIDGDVSQVEYYLDTDSFPAIVVGAISYDTTGANLVIVTADPVDEIGDSILVSEEEEEESKIKKKGVRIFITFFIAMVIIGILVCCYLHFAGGDDEEEEKSWHETDEEDVETLEMPEIKRGRSEVFLNKMYEPDAKSESAGGKVRAAYSNKVE